MEYGIETNDRTNRPAKKDAVWLLQQAADQGINLFDTAPAYGESEELLGEALGHRHNCYFATKVSIPEEDGMILTGKSLKAAIDSSLDTSLKALDRDWLDIAQIHNATVDVIQRGEVSDILLRTKERGKIRFLGASVYGEEAASAVVKAGSFDILQLAYNLLDQRMTDNILPATHQAGIGVVCRSALLKGVLTERAKYLPEELMALRRQAARAMNILAGSWQRLPQIALRFCISSPCIDTVLVGVCSRQELQSAIAAAQAGSLDRDELEIAAQLALSDEHLLNPSCWLLP